MGISKLLVDMVDDLETIRMCVSDVKEKKYVPTDRAKAIAGAKLPPKTDDKGVIPQVIIVSPPKEKRVVELGKSEVFLDPVYAAPKSE